MSELMLLGIVLVVALVLLVLLLIVWQRMSAWNGAREQQMQHAVSQLLQELDRSFDQAQQSGSEHNASLREHAGNLARSCRAHCFRCKTCSTRSSKTRVIHRPKKAPARAKPSINS